MAEIAQQLNPLLRGWIAYYGRYSRSPCPLWLITSTGSSGRGSCVSSSAFSPIRRGQPLREKAGAGKSRIVCALEGVRNEYVYLMGAV
ncbi:group II intron maturase-specific domain-containing protein [Mesorhizobium sp. M1076]|uniref:group II intron maturase-specific domain-containing protein n=1 Tax=Mesorhizobium sp. M1076 TaxID=2957054 RepID=UPI00333AD67A